MTGPVAIVGLGCRFPAGAEGDAGFWDLLARGGDAVAPVPADRWDHAAWFSPDPAAPGRTTQAVGGFLPDLAGFDAAFFGIAPREAMQMDPQQRLALEVAWAALEHAAVAPDSLRGTAAGVFFGVYNANYGMIARGSPDASLIDGWSASGTHASVVAGRIAFQLGLTGPAMVVDTACSSSLTAVHLAAQALRHGECDLALAGGVHLILSPLALVASAKLGAASCTGACRAFDAGADGFVHGEGCGVVVLRRLSEAQAAGERVLAIIAGSAVNQDGRSAGLTAPNGPAQEAVIRAALANAGVTPDGVDYIEAHGTGTALGDPIEMHALARVFAGRRRPLPVGSVKTNIGHAEAAAGIAGLIKAVLMLRHQAVPASLHFRQLNPHIDLAGVPLTVPTTLARQPLGCVGVSSFGFSGSNAHVVLQAAPVAAAAASPDPRPVHVLALAAREPAALRALAARWDVALTQPDPDLAALCHTAGSGRARLSCRIAAVAADAAAMRAALARDLLDPPAVAGKPRVAFLLTGQGSAYAGMAGELIALSPVFRAVLQGCDAVMGLPQPLARIFADAAALRRTEFAQPALFALSAGLGAVWRDWGIEPVALLGHSVGEYAAAHLAGVLTLEDAARLIAERGRLMQALPAGGAMAALLGDQAAARAVLTRHPAVELAAINSPAALTVAGPEAALAALLADPALASAGVAGQQLPLAHAFHSRLLEPMLDRLAAAAAAVPHAPPRVRVVGNLTGAVVARHDAAYWRAHARQPVRFAEGLATLAELGCTHLLELGAQPVLCGFARDAAPRLAAVPSLSRHEPGWAGLSRAAARLWRDGAPLDWAKVDAPFHPSIASAPTYPFQHQRYWSAATPSDAATLAGERVDLATGESVLRTRLDLGRMPFLADHVVLGARVVPGASHIVMLLAASGGALRDVVFATPLHLPDDGCDTQVLVGDGRAALYARSGDSWTLHASASTAAPQPAPAPVDRPAILSRCVADPDGPAKLHALLDQRGISLGPSFRGLRRLFRGDGEALVEVVLPDGVAPLAPLHPAQLDACFQALGATFTGPGTGAGGAFLPLAVDAVALHRPHAGPLWAQVTARPGGGTDAASGDVMLFTAEGTPVLSIRGLTVKRLGAAADPSERWTYRTVWQAVPQWSLPPADALREQAEAVRSRVALPPDDGLGAGLEALAAAYAARALAATTPADVVPAYRRLFTHLRLLAGAAAGDPDSVAAALRDRHGDRPELTLACRAGAALPGVLRGTADPLAVLFGEGATTVYADPPFARRLNAMVAAAVQGAVGARPPGERLRVLEIGAGTGAIFATLREMADPAGFDYTFTDIAPSLLRTAEARFAAAARYAALDIERPAAAQGFAPATFDVVVAANVLHATRDLRESLRHTAALLAPHGVLVLLEAVDRSNWSDLVFGLMPGWWRFADADLRPAHPLLSAKAWQTLLGACFADVAASDAGGQMLAIARAPQARRETVVWEAPPDLGPVALADAALRVAQDLLARPAPPALRIVTRGSQPVGAGVTSPDHAVVTGLGRVIAIEHPDLDCRLIDLPADAPATLVASAPAATREAAWRDGGWHVPALVRATLPSEPRFATRGTHLITGGLGGLGPLLADWLLDAGAERVVLMGRTPRDDVMSPTQRARATRPGAASRGGIDVAAGDVAQPGDIRRIIAGIDADGPPLAGVFHLAGTLSDASVLTLSRASLMPVFAAKVTGAQHLDAAVGSRALDAFVLFGSSAGLIGNAGQGAHAAANEYLGALAHARQRRGLAGLCVDWGAWGEAGTITRSAVGARLRAAGAVLMPPTDALRALGRAIVSGAPRVLIAAIDWPTFLLGYGDTPPAFFAAVAAPRPVQPPRRADPGGLAADPRASAAALAAFVAAAAARVLRAGPDEMSAADAPLNEAGLDSMMALELRTALATALDLQLPATLLFNFPTIEALTAHLAGLVGLADTARPAQAPSIPPPVPPDAIVDSVLRMTEAEMAAVIAREFALTAPGHV